MMNRIGAAVAAVLVVALAPAAEALDLNPLSAIKGAVEAVAEDRSSDDIANDTKIKAKIAAELTDKMGKTVISVGTDVYERDVMLTGTVDKAELRAEAGKLAAAVEGAGKVYNEIRVVKDADKKKGTAQSFVDDTVIEKKVEAQFASTKGINHTNLRWRSVDGHVYLFGRALSKAELDTAVKVAKGIEKVESVTSRVKIKPKSK